ncbi:hypothetical protein EZV62_001778 [Acer yangbiense]|uniref:GAG-pre-integrase domain-containing protein n=1 Tax=Acer yangbiense TaxID=1000413 RepID=A0A5C7IVV0_9ROSI|nr:hypothetical protein EZV62_001778 [Acer yangbiense]
MAKRNRRTANTSIEQHDPVISSLTDQIIETQVLHPDGQHNFEVPTADKEDKIPQEAEPSNLEDSAGEEETGSGAASTSKVVTRSDSYNFNNSFNPVMSMKFEIDKFDGTGDFGIWRRKVKALLSQQKILKAIEGPDKLPDSLNDEHKSDMLEMALGTIILNLSDNVLREVNEETAAYGKITIELANVGEKEKLSDENEVIILLNSLPRSFKDVKAAIKYGRTSLSLEECIFALKSKELELKIERKDNGENLFVRASKISDKGIFWHMRLGHMSERGILELSKRNLLNGDQVNKLEFRECCVLGKQHRISFSTAQHTSKQILEYVHSDL